MGIDISINNLNERKDGLKNYAEIISYLKNGVNVSEDVDYQRLFTGFFKVRRNAEWRELYYAYFQENKDDASLTFEKILKYLAEKTHRVEASFSSKMFAVINPKMPIWDSVVLNKLKGQLETTNNKAPDIDERIEKTDGIYKSICNWYERFMDSNDGKAKEWIVRFNKEFPEYNDFSDVKKIDFILWASGDTDPFDGKVY